MPLLGDEMAHVCKSWRKTERASITVLASDTVLLEMISNGTRSFCLVLLQLLRPYATLAGPWRLQGSSQVKAGEVIQLNSKHAGNATVNTCASIDHDCELAAQVSATSDVDPSCSGSCANGAHVGKDAAVRPSIRVGRIAFIGFGCNLCRDVANGHTIPLPKRGVTQHEVYAA